MILKEFIKWGLGIGDWGLGIGDWANPQSPIPNPQSPLLHILYYIYLIFKNYLINYITILILNLK